MSNEKFRKQITKIIKTEARNLVIKPLTKKRVTVIEKKIMKSHLCLWLGQGKPGSNGWVGTSLGEVLEGWNRGGESVKDIHEMLHKDLGDNFITW